MCRALLNGSAQPGKVRPGLRACNLSFGAEEIKAANYQGSWAPVLAGRREAAEASPGAPCREGMTSRPNRHRDLQRAGSLGAAAD